MDTENAQIVTPDQARQESYPDNQEVTVNSSGDTKEAGSNEVTTPTGETYTPTSNQNNVDIEKYQAVVNEVKTDSVETPYGKSVYRREVDSKNTGVAHDLESDQWMETRHSKEAPETDTFVSAQEVSEETIATRNRTTQELQDDGAKWRNDKGQFSKSGEGRLDATKQQIENARKEMTATDSHSQAVNRNREANEGFNAAKPVPEQATNALRDMDEKADRIKSHEDALESNKNANEGFNGAKPVRQPMKEALEDIDNISKDLKGKNFSKSLSELMDPKTAAKYNKVMYGEEETPKPEVVTPEVTHQDPVIQNLLSRVQVLEEQNRELRGENTWEQRSADYTRQLQELEEVMEIRPLTDEEKVRYFNLQRENSYIDKNIIAPEQEEGKKKRERKERIIKIVSGVAGGALALATPAVGVAAVVGVTLGGRLISKGFWKWKGLEKISQDMRAKSNAMKYEDRSGKTREQLDKMDKKQKRKAWWSDRLGEASAVILGGSTGYGIGAAIQNITGWRIGGGGNAAEVTGASTDGTNLEPQAQPKDLGTTNSNIGGGEGNVTVAEVTQGLNPENLPSKISFNDYPDLAKGLVQRGMDPSKITGDLYLQGTEGGWGARQGEALRQLLNRGINPDSKVAGWAIGEHAANGTPIETAIEMAQKIFAGN